MLRFFRKYLMNRWVLVVGGCMLMIVFLLPAGFKRGGGHANPLIGTIGGQKVYQAQWRQAGDELEILKDLNPLLQLTAAKTAGQWMLMLHEARQLGLSASESEAYEVLSALGMTAQDLTRISRRLNVPPPYVLAALQDYAMVWRYKPLVYGLAQMPLRERLQMFQSLYAMYGPQILSVAERLLPGLLGYPRLSRPLVERMLFDQYSLLSITALPIEAQRFAAQSPPPSEQRLQELFEQYRNTLPGQGRYGIGFLLPNRIKFEYLVLPGERLLQQAHVTEADAMDYYDQHRQSFRSPAATQPGQERPYSEVRNQIVQQLSEQQAADLADRILSRARALMGGPALSQLPQQDGYYVLPPTFQSASLREVADTIQREFNLLPDVRMYDRNWLTSRDLQQLEGISQATLASGRVQASFAQYALSTRELKPKSDNPLLVERLQLGVPSQTLIDPFGNRYLFRVTDAEAQRTPRDLSEVRPDVEAAARRLDAYQKLLAERDQWLQKAQSQSLEKLAADINAPLQNPPPFPRLTRTALGGLQPPEVLGLDPSSGFVPAAFDLAQAEPGKDTPHKPIGAIPADPQLTLYLVRVDQFQPMAADQYQRLASGQALRGIVAASLALGVPEDPLSFESLVKRLDFKAEGRTEQPDEAAQTPQSVPATQPVS